MRKTATIAAVASMGFLVAVVAALSSGRRAPRAVFCSPAVYSLGSIDTSETDEARAEFRLFNQTDRDLSIVRTMTSCICTGLDIPRYTVPANQYVDIVMKIKTRGVRGRQRVSAQIWTDDPEYPFFEIVGDGDLSNGDSADPSPLHVTLPQATPGQTIHHEFEVAGLAINDVSPSMVLDGLKVRVERLGEERGMGSKLVFDGPAPGGKGRRSATLAAEVAGVSDPVDVHVDINVVGRVEVVPSMISFGVAGPGEEVTREIRIVDRHQVGVDKVEMETGSSRVVVEKVQTIGAVTKAELRFAASSGEEFVSDNAKLLIELRDGTREKFVLPFLARIVESH